MKNLIKFSIVMVVLCITACTQTFENTSNEVQKKAQGRLVMNIGNESRTIKPAIGESDVKTAVLTANGEEIKSWTGDNIISQIQSTEDILLDVGNYNFTMTFRNAGNIDILTATTSKDIVAGNNSLNFNMKPVTTGTGDISITLTWDVASGIDKITAGLYDIGTNDPLEGFEDSVLEITTSNEQISTAPYSLSGVPVGQYIIKFKIYECETYEKLLNTLSEVINVAAGIITSSQITLSKINTQYSITYNLNGGEWAGNFIVTDERNANEKIILPTANDITRVGYEFGGWYDDDDNNRITEIPSDTMENIYVTAKWLQLYTITYNLNGGENNTNNPTSYTVETETITLDIPTKNDTNSTFLGWYNESGDKITEIKPSETAANITVTARWSTTCTVSEAKNVILELSGEGPYDIAVTGEITNVNLDIQAIKDGLNGNQGAKVNLDLSQTTEWDELPVWSFEGCINLTSIILPDSVTSIGDTAFQNCSNLKSINIPYGVTSIETNTFNGCSSLTEITIPDSVTSIAYNAFTDCNAVKTLVIGNSLTSFDNLPITSALESITIGDGITEIGAEKFKDFKNLTSVTIGGGVTKIGTSAFAGCTGLTSVEIPNNVTNISGSAFHSCSNLTEFIVSGDHTAYSSSEDNKVLYNKEKTTLFAYPSATGAVTIPDNVTTIGESAFEGCSNLTSVTIPDSVTTIGSSAFNGCSNLASVTIPDSVTTIGSHVFYGCGLTSVTIPDSVTTIGGSAFGFCGSLTSVTIPDRVTTIGSYAFRNCSKLASVTIGKNVTSIADYAFWCCEKLTSVTIPVSVIEIDYSAFLDCSSLTTVNYRGTEEEWGKIEIDTTNYELTSATKTYNYTGE